MSKRQNVISVSDQLLSSALPPVKLFTVPDIACEGQMDFIKRTSSDEVYIGLHGNTPSATAYDIVLTDTSPTFSENGVVIGDVKAIGSVATSKISAKVTY